MKKLYENKFHGLHIFGRHPYKEDDNKTNMQVDIAFLHRALPSVVIYRPLEPTKVHQLSTRREQCLLFRLNCSICLSSLSRGLLESQKG
jgi:hypothetical protein